VPDEVIRRDENTAAALPRCRRSLVEKAAFNAVIVER
jgi:hypothetical protein